MGARIEAVTAVAGRRGPFAPGARKLADRAGLACLERAGRAARELDLLINAGIYREDNLGEPALAALIQEDLGANPGLAPGTGGDGGGEPRHGTFSFDVANGGCGVVTALRLLDGMVRSGAVRLGMVVASDADPGGAVEPAFPFPPVGAAILVGAGAGPHGAVPAERDETGFAGFHLEAFPEFEDRFESRVSWRERAGPLGGRHHGKNVLTLREREGYLERCLDCAERATRRFLEAQGLEPGAIDLWIPSRAPVGFADGLVDRFGVGTDHVGEVGEGLEGAHTAGPLVSLEGAARSGQLAAARTVLFATVGAGIVVDLALYRVPRSE